MPPSGRVPQARDLALWHQRHAEFVAAGRTGQFDVLAIGDSLTWGWNEHRDVWAERVTSRPTGFFAIGGDTTNNLLWRLDHGELDGPPPKLVIVLIGTNNLWTNPDPADIADGITAVVGRVRERVPTAKVLVLGILPHGYEPTAYGRAVFAAVNVKLAALDDGRTVFVRELGTSLLEPNGTLSERVSYDATHLTREGYIRFADALGPIVRQLIGE